MKKTMLLFVIGMMLLGVASTFGATLDFGNLPGSQIEFLSGGTFSITPANPHISPTFQFWVTGPSASPNLGLQGFIIDGAGNPAVFTIGSLDPTKTSAPVTGSGYFILGAKEFIADLSWIDIHIENTGGVLNTVGTANLSNIFYKGLDAELSALAKGPTGAVLSFQFLPFKPLENIVSDGGTTSYSITIANVLAVPEAGALVLFGTGLIGLVGYRRVRRMQ